MTAVTCFRKVTIETQEEWTQEVLIQMRSKTFQIFICRKPYIIFYDFCKKKQQLWGCKYKKFKGPMWKRVYTHWFHLVLQPEGGVPAFLAERRDASSRCGGLSDRLPPLPAGLHCVQNEPQQGAVLLAPTTFLFPASTQKAQSWLTCLRVSPVCDRGAGVVTSGSGVGWDRWPPGRLYWRKFFPLFQRRGEVYSET